jgi:hypothetical protein
MTQTTDIHAVLADFNSMHPKFHFTAETEQNNALNYLDVTVHKTTNIKISVYRKNTFTDTLIPYASNHPTQHKYAAIRFLYNRLNSYNLHNEDIIIHNIIYNNFFPLHPQKPTTLNRNQLQNPPTNKYRWVTFTYVGKETTYITSIFKHSNIRIAYHTNNTLQNHLTHNNQNPDKFSLSRVYKLTCPNCKKVYIGYTGRDFIMRYKEHGRSF